MMISQLITRAALNVQRWVAPTQHVTISGHRIRTTKNHPLATYVNAYPLYDRFLPHLARYISGTVIDIGANIGDTTTAIWAANKSLDIVAVEPDPLFFSILRTNIQSVGIEDQVQLVNAFISNRHIALELVKSKSKSTAHTRTISDSESSTAPTFTYSDLLNNIGPKETSLIKIDTDGFDADILQSIADHTEKFENHSPIIFFEMQTYLQDKGFNDENRELRTLNFFAAMDRLRLLGYENYSVFDNFGTPILSSNDLSHLRQLNAYIRNSQLRNNHVPAYFFDILITPNSKKTLCLPALESYLKDGISI